MPWKEYYADEAIKHAILKSLRATCRQLHASCQDIFLSTFVENFIFNFTMDHVAVLSAQPTDFKGDPKSMSLFPATVPSNDIATPSQVARTVNRYTNLRCLSLFADNAPPQFNSESFYHSFIDELSLSKLAEVMLFDLTIAASDIITLISRQSSLSILTLDQVDLSTGSWDQVFTVCSVLPLRRFAWYSGEEDGERVWSEGETLPQFVLWDEDDHERLVMKKQKNLANQRLYGWTFKAGSQDEAQEYFNLFIMLYRMQRRPPSISSPKASRRIRRRIPQVRRLIRQNRKLYSS